MANEEIGRWSLISLVKKLAIFNNVKCWYVRNDIFFPQLVKRVNLISTCIAPIFKVPICTGKSKNDLILFLCKYFHIEWAKMRVNIEYGKITKI